MEIPQTQPRASVAESVSRWAVVVFLMLAVVTLAFGLGFGVNELLNDDEAPTTTSNVASNDDTDGDLSGSEELGAGILDEIYEILSETHINKDVLDPETFRQAAITGVLSTLNDRETSYLTQQQLESGVLDLASVYEGIGATVTDRNGVLEIVSTYRDSPAEGAGVMAGDTILAVEGEPTDGWTANEGVQVIRGPEGTEVTITVRHLDGTTEDITIVRGTLPIESVFLTPILEAIPGESGDLLVDETGAEVTDIAYVSIASVRDASAEELRTLLADVEDQGYRGLIVDLRGNSGGRLDVTIAMADEFLASGRILSQQNSDGVEEVWTATEGGVATTIPLVIIQDGSSASAAEVLSAALRDNGRGQIVGTQSFGKGTVNMLVPLESCEDEQGCGAIYVSIGRWYTPNGEQIEGVGVTPDLEVPMTSDQYIESGDLQLFKAIEILRGG